MIEIRHLEKRFGDSVILKDVSTVVRDGDVIAVIGPSGTGKSTLLRCLNLLDPPTGGQIIVDGTDITAKGCDISKIRQKMGMVFQSFNLFGHMTVIENIMYAPTRLLKRSRQEAYDRGMELLRKVGLAEKALNYPNSLSGGQQQRVAIARTLAMDPEIILFDEPTSALDPTMVREVQAVILDLAKSGKTMMIVTHEMRFARRVSNRVFYMDEGGIYEDNTPDVIFTNPAREKTIRFIRKMRELNLEIKDRNFDFAGAYSKIDRFGYQNQIPPRTVERILSVVEELCQQILIPALRDPDIMIDIVYAEEDGETVVTARYPGNFQLEDTDNDLALMVLKAQVVSLDKETADDHYRNIIRMKLRD